MNARLNHLLATWQCAECWEALWDFHDQWQDWRVSTSDRSRTNAEVVRSQWETHVRELHDLARNVPSSLKAELPNINSAVKPGRYTARELAERIQGIALRMKADTKADTPEKKHAGKPSTIRLVSQLTKRIGKRRLARGELSVIAEDFIAEHGLQMEPSTLLKYRRRYSKSMKS